MARPPQLKQAFESAYREFHCHFHREQDPVCLVHRYPRPRDQEIVAFWAALLAYGNVRAILDSVGRLLAPLGDQPAATLLRPIPPGLWRGFVHRWTTGEDVEIVAHWLAGALRSHGSLEHFFLAERAEAPWRERLESFVTRLTEQPIPPGMRATAARRQRNLKYLLPLPSRGSACKRMNLFLRWMVRRPDGIDLGLWRSVDPAHLMLPVDVHLLRILQSLGWTRSRNANWKVVEQATERLRRLCPEDPIRYDFALCHMAMAGEWKGVPAARKEITHAPME